MQTQTPPVIDSYRDTVENRDGFIHEDSPLRTRRSRMPLAVLIVSFLTTAALFAALGFAIGSSLAGA